MRILFIFLVTNLSFCTSVDVLPALSDHREVQLTHLTTIFMRCRYYCIRLNPHKCVFCVKSSRLLGFIVSKDGIRIDPFKVEAILALPPPSSLHQLQSLQVIQVDISGRPLVHLTQNNCFPVWQFLQFSGPKLLGSF